MNNYKAHMGKLQDQMAEMKAEHKNVVFLKNGLLEKDQQIKWAKNKFMSKWHCPRFFFVQFNQTLLGTG